MDTNKAVEIFDASELDTVDSAEMVVVANGRETSWKWFWAGPAHEKTLAQSDRLTRERLRAERMQEQAIVNRKKYKAEEITPEELRVRNINFLLERLLGWSPVKLGGQDFPFTEANARQLLSDPRKPALYNQAWEFLGGEEAFTKRSATTSAPSPSVPSSSTPSSKAVPGGTD